MKKIILSILSVLFVFMFCSCDRIEKDEIDISKIYEVDNGQCSTEKDLNHKFLLSSTPKESFDKSIQSERTLDINGVKQKLRYKSTLYYEIGNSYVYKYFVDDNEDKVILLDNSGKIDSILYKYTVLDISNASNSDEVLALLKDELHKFVDLSFYSDVTVEESHYGSRTTYSYLFFNRENGYVTDSLGASVNADGEVFGIKINNLNVTKPIKVDVNKEKEQQAIERKLKDIYNTESSQYISYQTVFEPRIVVYEDQLYTEHAVSATYNHGQYGKRLSFLNTILIPLEMINN